MRKLQSTTQRHRLRGVASVAALAVALGVGALVAPGLSAASIARSAAATTHAKGVEIATVVGPFGPQLVVGNGPLKGFSVYAITRDSRTTYGCTTAVFHGPGGAAFP